MTPAQKEAQRIAFLNDPASLTFADELNYKTFTVGQKELPLGQALTALQGEFPDADKIFAQMDPSNVNLTNRLVFPRTWDDFITTFRTQEEQTVGNTRSGPTWNAFLQEYQTILNTTLQGGGDFQGLSGFDTQQQFVASFNQFLATYPFTSETKKNADGTTYTYLAAGPSSQFYSLWRTFMTQTAQDYLKTQQSNAIYANISNYEQIYHAFFENGSSQDFQTLLKQFYDQEMADPDDKNHYFLPSQMLSDFYKTVKEKYLTTIGAADSVEGTGSDKLQIFWKLFNLVAEMINTIQRAAAAESELLTFYTDYQGVYTDVIAQIPTYTQDDGSPYDGTKTTQQNQRDSINTKNNALVQTLQSYRDFASNQAKQVQATVDQLNEASNNQASLATSLLQTSSSILSSIFR